MYNHYVFAQILWLTLFITKQLFCVSVGVQASSSRTGQDPKGRHRFQDKKRWKGISLAFGGFQRVKSFVWDNTMFENIFTHFETNWGIKVKA